MEASVLVLIALVAWFLWNRRAKERERQTAVADEPQASALVKISRREGTLHEEWAFHFPTMTGKITDGPRVSIRRTHEGRWQFRLARSEVDNAVRKTRPSALGDPADSDYVAP